MDKTQLQMLLRKQGMPLAPFRDQVLLDSVFSLFDGNADNTISWKEFSRLMNIFKTEDVDKLLKGLSFLYIYSMFKDFIFIFILNI